MSDEESWTKCQCLRIGGVHSAWCSAALPESTPMPSAEPPDFADTLAELASMTDRDRRNRDGWRAVLQAAWEGGFKVGRREASPTEMNAAWDRGYSAGVQAPSTPSSSLAADDLARLRAWAKAGSFSTHIPESCLVTGAEMLAAVRRETIEACASWVASNCGTMNGNRMAREMAALFTRPGATTDTKGPAK